MEILFLLIPLSLVLVALIVWAFLWAIRSGQFDDLDGPPYRVLLDEERVSPEDDAQGQDEGESSPSR